MSLPQRPMLLYQLVSPIFNSRALGFSAMIIEWMVWTQFFLFSLITTRKYLKLTEVWKISLARDTVQMQMCRSSHETSWSLLESSSSRRDPASKLIVLESSRLDFFQIDIEKRLWRMFIR